MKARFVLLLVLSTLSGVCSEPMLVQPYVQNPAPSAMSLLWVARSPAEAQVRCWQGDTLIARRQVGGHEPARALAYSPSEVREFGPNQTGYQRELRLTGLSPGQLYRYEVEQDGQVYSGEFRTTPSADTPIRFVAYSDSETEPESRGTRVRWEDPARPGQRRDYLVDQDTGYRANLTEIERSKPDFVVIPGDLVETGGEQRDWDEFWLCNRQLSRSVPIVGVLGNHEYYGGPNDGRYEERSSERAVAKFLTYFRSPPNDQKLKREQGRYFRMDYGPISLIAIDGCNGLPHQSERDSNWHLASQARPQGDFNPGSQQYLWLEQQLRQAQKRSHFTFVCFHHCPYSSGLHAFPPGQGDDHDRQSVLPLRVLTPLFMRYGVDALLCGHDEMMERSELSGEEITPDGERRPHKLEIYDVGIGGDGLRGPEIANPWRKFLAHSDCPEVWKDGRLLEGGKHYGHLQVDVSPVNGRWQARFTPVYLLPVQDGREWRFERRLYPDPLILLEGE
ncbi:metallophosphoesterase family protein [bacterium]|nr:metallophosphoesterase family protein [bacterium]